MTNTLIATQDKLPLTCSRTGTCCYGKQVLLNPWELATLSHAKGIGAKEFSRTYCEFGGARLMFNGPLSARGERACSQYVGNFGCSLHPGRPLVCRLYPIGRRRQHDQVQYIYEGHEFPCMNGCPEVTELPYLTTAEYLEGQQAEQFELAQDMYLELMQSIADIAFTLLLDSGLSESGDTETLAGWRAVSQLGTSELVQQLPVEWLDMLMLPEIEYCDQAEVFIQHHAEYIQTEVQQLLDGLQSLGEFGRASVHAFSTALLLGFGLGTDIQSLAAHWIEIARANGAQG